jgi:hypothetical protein
MLRSTLQLVRQLSDQLLLIPAIVRGFEKKSPGALAELMRWLDRTEQTMSGHGLVAAADIAGHKARILAPAFDDDRRGTLRRRQLGIAIALLHELQQSAQDALRPHAAKVQQGRDLARQLLQIVAQSGAVHYDPGNDIATMVDQVWALCTGHEQLKPLTAQLRALLSSDDIRLLLAEEIEPLDFPLRSAAR